MNKEYSRHEINDLLSSIKGYAPFLNEHKFFVLTKELLETTEDEDLLELAGYKAKFTTDGAHKNDSHMVEYTFTLKSPAGEITKIVTEMCCSVGFNHWQTEIIK
jgi:hypothetical protein